MADFSCNSWTDETGTQFSDLPSSLAIDILLRLPLKTLLICRYVCKDWTQLYLSDPYFIKRQLETSNIQFLKRYRTREGGKFQFGCIVDEVSTGNLRIEALDLSCKFLPDPKHEWFILNSCNGLVCLIDKPGDDYDGDRTCSSVYVCNPILGEWISIPFPYREGFYRSDCVLGFSAKNNQYKILLCITIGDMCSQKYEWRIYTLGTRQWRSIETKENTAPWKNTDLDFNTCIHGSLHWSHWGSAKGVTSFDFETERFTVFSLPEIESAPIQYKNVALGVINGCLWASFYNGMQCNDGEMWAMKEYGVDESWTMMLAIRTDWSRYYQHDPPDEVLKARHNELVIYRDDISSHRLLFTLNGEEMLISDYCTRVICYNIKGTMRRRALAGQFIGCVTAYNPSFVWQHGYGFGRGEQVISGRHIYDGLMKKKLKEKLKKKTKEKLKKKTKKKLKRVWF